MKRVMIAPSILSADFGKLADEIEDIEKGGADVIHVDVMDGNFVPNLTIGPVVIKGAKKRAIIPLDVHLMINEPIRYIDDYRNAGADWITVHYEACADIIATLEAIKKSGAKVGISIKPKTEIDENIKKLFPMLDLILFMSVEPGFGGQKFMPEILGKIEAIRSEFDGFISIDGGINIETAPLARNAGVDVMVAGTAVFGQDDRKAAIESLR